MLIKTGACLLLLLVAAQAANVSGNWDIALETPQGKATPWMTLSQDGEKITGTYHSARFGEARLEGTLRGSEIRFSVTFKLEDQPFTSSFAGTVEADRMKGTVRFGDRGSGDWTAKKRP